MLARIQHFGSLNWASMDCGDQRASRALVHVDLDHSVPPVLSAPMSSRRVKLVQTPSRDFSPATDWGRPRVIPPNGPQQLFPMKARPYALSPREALPRPSTPGISIKLQRTAEARRKDCLLTCASILPMSLIEDTPIGYRRHGTQNWSDITPARQ